jgi:GMP synthase (glutamine-hydrolysing)
MKQQRAGAETGAPVGGPAGGVLIVDFGAQYCQLIARRVRELGVYSRITVPERAMFTFAAMRPQAVILSGGPRSVYEHDAPALDRAILDQGVPVLGICYGLQWMAQHLGGQVTPAQAGAEYGRTELEVVDGQGLLAGVRQRGTVWMSHGDKVSQLPKGFAILAQSEPCPFAVVADRARGFYGLQFHPEVAHTQDGQRILQNFVLEVAHCSADWDPGHIVQQKIDAVRAQVGERGEVVLGLSGGVDSSVAAAIVHKAIGSRLHCVFVDNGLLRLQERDAVEQLFLRDWHMDLKVVDAGDRFLSALAGVTDPEQKRKIVGKVFVDVFKHEAKAFGNAHFLGQGTLYPDVIESVAAHRGARRRRSRATTTSAGCRRTSTCSSSSRCATCSRTRCARSAANWACPRRWSCASRSRARASPCAASARSRATGCARCARPTRSCGTRSSRAACRRGSGSTSPCTCRSSRSA